MQACAPHYIATRNQVERNGIIYNIVDPNGRCILFDSNLDPSSVLQFSPGTSPWQPKFMKLLIAYEMLILFSVLQCIVFHWFLIG